MRSSASYSRNRTGGARPLGPHDWGWALPFMGMAIIAYWADALDLDVENPSFCDVETLIWEASAAATVLCEHNQETDCEECPRQNECSCSEVLEPLQLGLDLLRQVRAGAGRLTALADEGAKALVENAELRRKLQRRHRSVPPGVRSAVLARDKYRCRYCGDLLKEGSAQMDHYDPNGSETEANLVVACALCNRRKGSVSPRRLRRLRSMTLLGRSVDTPPTEVTGAVQPL